MESVRMFQQEMETIKRGELRELQLRRLQDTVRRCYENVPHYRTKLDEAGVTPDRIRSLDDVRRLPFTLKTDLRDNYPYGLFAVDMKDVVRLHASSGTTGKPVVGGYTKKDLERWSDLVARLIVAVGITERDIIQIAFGYGLFTGALGLHYAVEKVGATVVPASSGNTERQLMLLEDFGVTALVATPSYALYMSELVREQQLKDRLKLRIGLFGSEACTPEMRSKIETDFGLFATDNYGMTELMGPGISGECIHRCGLHINEDHFLCEIIDPDTGETLPEGSTGELVVTSLTKEAMPILRYRTRDITRLIYEPCRCGRTLARMDKITGRSDDMLIIKGVNVFPSQIESVLVVMPQIGPHYQLVVRRENYMDTLEVKVELTDGSLLERYGELEKLQGVVRAKLHSVLGLDCRVTLAEPKSLERFQGKAKRVLDLRSQTKV